MKLIKRQYVDSRLPSLFPSEPHNLNAERTSPQGEDRKRLMSRRIVAEVSRKFLKGRDSVVESSCDVVR